MGITIKWDITYKCNLNCSHCINGDLLNKLDRECSTEQAKEIIDTLGSRNIEYVHLLGGEPTARKDFYELINYFNEKQISFGFNTNGLKLFTSNPEHIINSKCLKNIVFSLEGPTAEINDSIRGKKVFERVKENLIGLIKLKRDYSLYHMTISVNTVVSKANQDFTGDMIDFCSALGVDELNLLEYISSGNAKDNDLSLSIEEELRLIEQIALKYPSVKNTLKINPKFLRPLAGDYCKEHFGMEFPQISHGCGAGTTFGFINNKGELYPCDRFVPLTLKENLENDLLLYKRNFYDIWGTAPFDQPFELTEGHTLYDKYKPCNSCKYLRNLCYPCPAVGLGKDELVLEKCMVYLNLIGKSR